MTKFLLWSVLLIVVVSCKKEPLNQLPKATQEGKNTAGFLVDGRAFTPHEAEGFGSGINPANSTLRKTKAGRPLLEISMSDKRGGRQEGVGIGIVGIRQPGTYVLNEVPAPTLGDLGPGDLVYYSDHIDPLAKFYSGPETPATIVITRFDTINNIVSGTFEASPREVGGTRIVHLTHGRFDIRFTR